MDREIIGITSIEVKRTYNNTIRRETQVLRIKIKTTLLKYFHIPCHAAPILHLALQLWLIIHQWYGGTIFLYCLLNNKCAISLRLQLITESFPIQFKAHPSINAASELLSALLVVTERQQSS